MRKWKHLELKYIFVKNEIIDNFEDFVVKISDPATFINTPALNYIGDVLSKAGNKNCDECALLNKDRADIMAHLDEYKNSIRHQDSEYLKKLLEEMERKREIICERCRAWGNPDKKGGGSKRQSPDVVAQKVIYRFPIRYSL